MESVDMSLLDTLVTWVRSPLFFVQATIGLVLLLVAVAVVWIIARTAEKKNFTEMLKRLSLMTTKLKDAEHFGHFGSFAWDVEPEKDFWSEEMFNLFDLMPGQKPPSIEKVMSMITAEDRDQAAAAWEKARTYAGNFSLSFRVMGAGNVIRYLRFDGKTTLGPDKKPKIIEGVAHDITKDVEVDRAKSEFVSLASHQLKTPLTAIGWLSEGLLSGDKGSLTDEQRKYIENIHTTDRQMMEMVNDLLNVSRIELGTLQLHPEDIDLLSFVHNIFDEQKKVADDKHIIVTLNIDENLPHVTVDKNLLRMVFQNLLSNAIKYTPAEGKVTLDITKGTGTKETVFVRVADTGIGIPKEEHDKVFSKLHRAQNAVSFMPDGTGLGLYVVKTIIERVKGVITFESAENKGTTFFVTLPVVWRNSSSEG